MKTNWQCPCFNGETKRDGCRSSGKQEKISHLKSEFSKDEQSVKSYEEKRSETETSDKEPKTWAARSRREIRSSRQSGL